MKIILLTLAAITVLWSCSEKKDSDSYELRPVVEGYLYANYTPTVKIEREYGLDETSTGESEALNNLNVILETEDTSIILYSSGNGVYTTDSSFKIKENTTYALRFDLENTTVSAATYVPDKPKNFKSSVTSIDIPSIDFSSGPPSSFPEFPDPVEYTWDNPEGSYYILVVENLETNPVSVVSGEEEDVERPTFRNEPTTSNRYEITSMAFNYFGYHRVILFKLNADYASLYNTNNNNSLNLTNPQTNIENGLGIFTGINSDTLYIQVNED